MVTLICGDQSQKFPVQQAQSILYIQKQMRLKGWVLPDDSPYEYIDNALRTRADKGDCKEKATKGPTPKSNKSRAKAEVPHRDDSDKA